MFVYISAAIKPTVSFRTSATSSFTLSSTNNPIIFQYVDFNIGNAYDGTTGKFTPPVNGMYMFVFHICMYSSSSFYIHIVVDDVSVTRSLVHSDSSHYQCLTATDALNLTAGAKVWIRWYPWGSAAGFIHNDYARAYFTGLLV